MKKIFLTGGTGSFGQAFTSYALEQGAHVRVFSRDEHKQQAMRRQFPSGVAFFIGDIRDKERLKRAMDGCDWVVHAAALKQAPLGEIEPQEFIKTNIDGSLNVIEAALDSNIEKAVLISSDKAVEPINLYGATKMCAEKAFIQANQMRGTKKTRFAFTRYGNVAGTNGSIIPLFMNLGPEEPTPICHKDCTRFWISLEDAVKYVYDSISQMKGGEAFIPRLKSVRVLDIAEAVRPGKPVKYIGLRPGDKTHEVLSIDGGRYSSDKNEFMGINEIKRYVYRTAEAELGI